jgi:flagellar basal-body rod protein FlgC
MTIGALDIGLSGLQSCQGAVDITANNIANANTPGFKAQQAQFQEKTPSGSGVQLGNLPGSDPASGSGTGPSDTDLAYELVNLLTYKLGFEANAKVVKTSGEMLGTLFDQTG